MTTLHVPQLGSRLLYPDLQSRVYLAHAAVSPVSAPVRAAVEAVVDGYAQVGVGAFPPWIHQRLRLKETLARLLGCTAADLALMQSTTAGVLAVALSLPWQVGDVVVLTRGEFPANVTPWQQAAVRFGLQIHWLPQPDPLDLQPWLRALDAALEARPRLLAISAVQFQTGLAMPLAQICALCHAAGTQVCADAVQAFGAIPLDVGAVPVDYLMSGAHKWLGGMEGAGFLYVAPHRAVELHQTMAGWLSHEDGIGFLMRGPGHLRHDRPLRTTVDFLEVGNLSTMSFAAMGAAVDLLEVLGIANIHAHVQPILDELERGVHALGFASVRAQSPDLRSCTLAVLPPADLDVVALAKALSAAGIAVSIPDGYLRLAPHWSNSLQEVPAVLAAMESAVAGIRSGSSSTLPRGS